MEKNKNNNLTPSLFIGGYTGLNKSGKPYYVIYIGVPMTDKDGNSIGIGYKPLTFYVEKDEYMDLSGLTCGCAIKIRYTFDKRTDGSYKYILKTYDLT